MNKKLSVLLATAVFASMLTACQGTPTKPIVVSKGDGQLEQKIMATETPVPSSDNNRNGTEPSPPSTKIPPNGERIQKQLQNKAGTVDLTVDAEVVRYDNQSFPAVTIVPQKFSQQQADSIIQALVGDLKFYSPTQLSREKLNDTIIFYKQQKEKAPDDKKDNYESIIKKFESMLATAVPEEDLSLSSKQFSKAASIQYSESIAGKFQKNSHEYVLRINNNEDGTLSDVDMSMVGPGTFSIVNRAGSDTADSLVTISYNQALQQAQQLVKDMQSDLSLEDSFVVESEPDEQSGIDKKNYAYQFIFTREVNGFHVVYDTSVLGTGGT